MIEILSQNGAWTVDFRRRTADAEAEGTRSKNEQIILLHSQYELFSCWCMSMNMNLRVSSFNNSACISSQYLLVERPSMRSIYHMHISR
mmetsp:Transcript_42825/g.89950  ORF Transcript_42825/g.89950 Transcript_42825/m.89950 type:complete len:89 (+) Transcript_42825:3-269(+)